MIQGLLGKKLGMTQIFDETGQVVPVTVLEVGPCVVTQVRTTRTGTGTRRCSSDLASASG